MCEVMEFVNSFMLQYFCFIKENNKNGLSVKANKECY